MIEMKPGQGNNKVFGKIEKLSVNTNKAIRNALYDVGRSHVVHSRGLMSENKSGRVYKIKGSKHQASAPGEAPANLSGALSRSVDYMVHGNNDLEFGYRKQVGKAPYGRFLEFGEGVSKRPNLFRTAADKRQETHTTIMRELAKVL